MNAHKNSWEAPELIVLVRSNPEEAVLTNCKTQDNPGPDNTQSGCQKGTPGGGGNCGACQSMGVGAGS